MKERLAHCWVLAVAALVSVGAASAGEGVVALQSAEASCDPGGSTDIYYPCDNGTATDLRTGLVWLANANCFGEMGWHEAMAAVAGLSDLDDVPSWISDCGLSDGSSPGEWRLPSISEWKAMVTDLDCVPAISNDIATNCWVDGCYELGLCSFYDVQADDYWSSTSFENPSSAWYEVLNWPGGSRGNRGKDGVAYVWPVRGGQ